MDIKYNRHNSAFNIFSNKNRINNAITKIMNRNLLSQISNLEKKINLENELRTSKIRPKELILDALKIGEKIKSKEYQNNKNKKVDIILDTKMVARTVYIDISRKKSKLKVNDEFKEILKEVNKKAIVKLDKNLEEILKIKNSYDKMIHENEMLELKLSNINKDIQNLHQKLSIKKVDIDKFQTKFEPFRKEIPFFEELIHQFPNEEPENIIHNLFSNKKKSLEQLNKLNSLEREYFEMYRSREKESQKEIQEKEIINKKIIEEKLLFERRKKSLEEELEIYKNELNIIKTNFSQKSKFTQMLINLYKNIKKFIPEQKYNQFIKKIGFDPLKREDKFDPTIFNNINYILLVKETFANKVSDCYDGILLRITIVFANYLARKYLSHNKNKNYRYDPVSSFRDIKSLVDNKNFENYRLKGVIEDLKKKKSDLKVKKRDIENLLKKSKMKYYDLLRKLELAKKIQITSFKTQYDNSKTLDVTNERKDMIQRRERIKSSFPKSIKIENNNKDNIFKTLELSHQKKANKFFITHIDKSSKNKKKNIKRIFSATNYNFKHKGNINNNKRTKIYQDKESEAYEELRSKFRDLEISKNRDKLFKTNGINSSENIFINIKTAVKEMLKHEEDLQLIKDSKKKEKKLVKKDNLTIETNSHVPILFRKLKKKEKLQRPFSSLMTDDKNYKNISDNIIKNIDNMIDSIKKIELNNLKNEKYDSPTMSSNNKKNTKIEFKKEPIKPINEDEEKKSSKSDEEKSNSDDIKDKSKENSITNSESFESFIINDEIESYSN